MIATEQHPVARQVWREATTTIPPETLVFLDETSTQVTMTRSRGRASRGERVIDRVPRNHGQNLTCLAALTPTGIQAPCVVAGAVDGLVFLQWLREWLLPSVPRGTTIGMDNLSVHRNPDVRTAIEDAGCFVLFLPAYSPDFNPIEHVFAQLKTHLRGVAARTPDGVMKAIGAGFACVTPAQIRATYAHCGYRLPDDPSQPT